jgi:hypothetical protein
MRGVSRIKYYKNHLASHHVLTLLSAQNLSDSNFPEAAAKGVFGDSYGPQVTSL